MSRGNQYPSERFDGSPFFLGKKRKPQQAGESETDPGRPLTDLNGRLSTDSEQFVIVESDSETRQDVQEQPVRKKCNIFREDSANSVANTKGTNFDFSADVEVQALNKAVMSVIDPDGKRRNDNRLQSESVANVSAKKNEILGSGVTASGSSSFDRNSGARFARKSPVRGGGGKKKTSTTIRGGWNFGDLAGDFRSASGSTKIQKEVKAVVPLRSDSQSSSQSDSGLPPGSKFLGNKRITASSVTGSTFGSKRPPVSMTMGTDGGGRDQQKNGCSLKADNPSLKNFEDNIITLIESEIMLPQSDIGWADVAGLEAAKKALREIVVLPFKRPDIFKGIRAPPKGVLLFGPPGTGKTMIGKCVASQSKATFFNISASSLTSKWVGEGEKLVRALFAVARIKLPSVIFIDEIDSLLSSRSESEHESSRRIKTEFLVQLDGVATNSDERLLVLGATNRPYELDEAARRRFAKRLYIALPETEARLRIIRNLLTNMEHALHETDYEQIGRLTEGYSGADMRQLCSEAAMGPIREIDAMEDADIETIPAERIRPISGRDFIEAARLVRATVVADDLQVYANWDKKFGCLL